MHVRAIVFAVLGALVGALAWALVAFYASVEIGYLAWGIGGLVGVAAAWAGGRGVPLGITCAVLALASIFMGKLVAMQWSVEHAIDEQTREVCTTELLEELREDAAAFIALSSEADYPQFMINRGFTDADEPADIPTQDLEEFHEHRVAQLRWIHEHQPTLAQWIEHESREHRRELLSAHSLVFMVREDLNPIDLLFAFLGVATAFGIARRGLNPAAAEPPPVNV
ncbi:MAG: hypothetical protein IPM18_00570 [Phycisphaerales bacterium]|nr:hypothetical protein [Phycisphaerales bacterium]